MSVSTEHEAVGQLDLFLQEVLEGLSESPKTLPCKYFYDQRGSMLFDEICELDEYYLTRTESQIMQDRLDEMVESIGDQCVMIEFGSGSSTKTRMLLEHLKPGSWYVPIDISGEHLRITAAQLAEDFPELVIHPIAADFTQLDELPDDIPADLRRAVYFPGSTIGNFPPEDAAQLLHLMRTLARPSGAVLIGVDLAKSTEVLIPAYNDSEGVTAAFNLNLLERINRELDCSIPIEAFRHEARFNPEHSRMEMHLVIERDLEIVIGDRAVAFESGESIHTENSYKYSHTRFREIAAQAGWQIQDCWTDEDDLFSVQFLTSCSS